MFIKKIEIGASFYSLLSLDLFQSAHASRAPASITFVGFCTLPSDSIRICCLDFRIHTHSYTTQVAGRHNSIVDFQSSGILLTGANNLRRAVQHSCSDSSFNSFYYDRRLGVNTCGKDKQKQGTRHYAQTFVRHVSIFYAIFTDNYKSIGTDGLFNLLSWVRPAMSPAPY